MDNKDYTLDDLIDIMLKNRLSNFHTALPAQIVDFDPVKQTAVIQPVIQRALNDGTFETMSMLYDVPVKFQKSGGYSISIPVLPGDECLLLVCERSISNWIEKGEILPPSHFEKGSLSDAVALIGFKSEPKRIEDFDNERIVIRNDDNNITFKLSQDDIELKTDKAEIKIDKEGNITVKGEKADIECREKVSIKAPETDIYSVNTNIVAETINIAGAALVDINSAVHANLKASSIKVEGTSLVDIKSSTAVNIGNITTIDKRIFMMHSHKAGTLKAGNIKVTGSSGGVV